MSNALLPAAMDTTDALPLRKSSHLLFEDRLKSFDTWPKQMRPQKHVLAKAGFVYSGKSDKVYCFNCRIVLHDWEASNEPWSEHEKWSPDCSYLKIVGYTEASVGAVRPNMDEIDNGRNSTSTTSTTSNVATSSISSGFRFGGLGGFGSTGVPTQTSTSTSAASAISSGFRFGSTFGSTSVGQNSIPTQTSTSTSSASTGGINCGLTTTATTTAPSIFRFGQNSSTTLPSSNRFGPHSYTGSNLFVLRRDPNDRSQSNLF